MLAYLFIVGIPINTFVIVFKLTPLKLSIRVLLVTIHRFDCRLNKIAELNQIIAKSNEKTSIDYPIFKEVDRVWNVYVIVLHDLHHCKLFQICFF